MQLHERLAATRERAGLTLNQVSKRTGIGESSICEFEKGTREPSLAQLQSLAECYHLSISHFFETTEIREPVVLWRSQPASPTSNDVRARFLEMCSHYHNLEMWCDDHVRPRLPKCSGSPEQLRDPGVEFLASKIHKELDLGNRPGSTLLRVLEEVCGVKVFHEKFDDQFAACTVDETLGAAILLNSNTMRVQRNFDLAHELFHLITWNLFRHDQDDFGKEAVLAKDEEETFANAFARALLMPRDAVIEAINPFLNKAEGKLSFDDLFDIARQFDVDVETIMIRLGDIYPTVKESLGESIKRYQETAKDRHIASIKDDQNSVPEKPARFRALAFRALREAEISVGKFSQYVGMARSDAMKLVEMDLMQESEVNEEIALTPA